MGRLLGVAVVAAVILVICTNWVVGAPSTFPSNDEVTVLTSPHPMRPSECVANCGNSRDGCYKWADGFASQTPAGRALHVKLVNNCMLQYNQCCVVCQSLPPGPTVAAMASTSTPKSRMQKMLGEFLQSAVEVPIIEESSSSSSSASSSKHTVGLIGFWPDGTCQNTCQNMEGQKPASWLQKCYSSCPPCKPQCSKLADPTLKYSLEFCQMDCDRMERGGSTVAMTLSSTPVGSIQDCRDRCDRDEEKCIGAISSSCSNLVDCSTRMQRQCFAKTSECKNHCNLLTVTRGISCERSCIDIADDWRVQAFNSNECDAYQDGRAQACSQWAFTQSQAVITECQSCCSTIYRWTHSCVLPPIPKFPGA